MTQQLGLPRPTPYGSCWDEWSSWADDLPASRHLGLRCDRITHGQADLVLDRTDWPLNPNGAVHGGLVAACVDHGMGIAALTTLNAERTLATATLAMDFLRPAFAPLTFETVVERSGKTLAFVKVTVLDKAGKVVARCNGTMAIS